jgi:hypothetical protein
MIASGEVTYDVPVGVAFDYLADPRNRPEWQSSLRRVELLDEGEPRVGMRWHDHTAAGVVPLMWITELDPGRVWSEDGRWRFLEASLELGFRPAPTGCVVTYRFSVRGHGPVAPLGWALTTMGRAAVRSDLRRAGRILAARR